jgi:hypothetical protein
VTNSGTSAAAVLNFGIPQGAAGSASSGGSSGGFTGLPAYHLVSGSYFFYPVQTSTVSPTATTVAPGVATDTLIPYAALTWVPNGCTATKLSVASYQSNNILVALRSGATVATMADTTLSCSVANGATCSATGSVSVPAGGFIDLHITNTSGTGAAVWTSLVCQ